MSYHTIFGFAASVVVPAGVFALVVGSQVLGLLLALTVVSGVQPASLYEWWVAAVAAVAAGWVLTSGGSCQAREALAFLRHRTRRNWAALLAGTGTAAFILPTITRQTGSSGRTVGLVAVGGMMLLLASFFLWIRRKPASTSVHALSPRTLANLLIVTFLSTSAVTSVAKLPDVYPLSRYPMFSDARLDPYTWDRVRFLKVDETGASRTLPDPASRIVPLRMAVNGDVHGLRELAVDLRAKHSAPRVRVILETLRVAPHPEPPQVEVVASQELVTVDGN